MIILDSEEEVSLSDFALVIINQKKKIWEIRQVLVPDFRCFWSLKITLLRFTKLPPGFQLNSSVRFQDVLFRIPECGVDTIGACSMLEIRCPDFTVEDRVKSQLTTTVDGSW